MVDMVVMDVFCVICWYCKPWNNIFSSPRLISSWILKHNNIETQKGIETKAWPAAKFKLESSPKPEILSVEDPVQQIFLTMCRSWRTLNYAHRPAEKCIFKSPLIADSNLIALDDLWRLEYFCFFLFRAVFINHWGLAVPVEGTMQLF